MTSVFDLLQWRAGQLPGQTRCASGVRARPARFNGGPDNCPARLSTDVVAQPSANRASMEGRTIARPDRWATRPPTQPPRCFNGGPDNCPARPRLGRARPARHRRFNGGPDNCPARHRISQLTRGNTPLQWRAGQLPGQTATDKITHAGVVALQWRAGQLPGQTVGHPRQCRVDRRLQWRAGQLPGQTGPPSAASASASSLQWRAGQLPGQTSGRGSCFRRALGGFNGGPDNCPARPRSSSAGPRSEHGASMEGRTIARPDGTS